MRIHRIIVNQKLPTSFGEACGFFLSPGCLDLIIAEDMNDQLLTLSPVNKNAF